MIRRKGTLAAEPPEQQPRGFDDFDLRLGDIMRGERATMGKSLLDVQRELRIKASYIAAIENCDPNAFDTPGFIAGYVRSYARYLNMDPDQTFAAFCAESGFATAHGMSAEASTRRKPQEMPKQSKDARAKDPFITPNTPFVPAGEGFFARIEPGAVGSALVLLALIGAIGFGGWTVLNEVQRVQMAPVENTPDVLTDLNPLASDASAETGAGPFSPPGEGLDRLYRPQALDVPVLVARDAPISTLDPNAIGSFAQMQPQVDDSPAPNENVVDRALAMALGNGAGSGSGDGQGMTQPQVVETPEPGVAIFAVRPAWVRVRAADGSVIFEKILDAGETYDLPQTEEAPVLRAGMSGSLYFKVNGEIFGPAGQGTGTIRNVALSVEDLTQNYAVADLSADPEAARVFAVAQAEQAVQTPVAE
ncbi:helix-turn-helix domain-containing protein [Pseudooceanicola sp. 502str34]